MMRMLGVLWVGLANQHLDLQCNTNRDSDSAV